MTGVVLGALVCLALAEWFMACSSPEDGRLRGMGLDVSRSRIARLDGRRSGGGSPCDTEPVEAVGSFMCPQVYATAANGWDRRREGSDKRARRIGK